MRNIDYISLILLISFLIAYFSKLTILKNRNKINANVLGKRNKNKNKSTHTIELLAKTSSLMWAITWLVEIFLHNKIPSSLVSLFSNNYASYIGTIIIFLGVFIFILAVIYMKTSWRVGIDKNTKSKLITNGIYKFSRNPAFVGFDLMFLGLFISYANILTLIILILNLISFHLLILQEEKHLSSMFGEDYTNYKNKVSRYFLIF